MGRGYGTPLLLVTNASAGSADEERVAAALAVLTAKTDVRREVCRDPADLDGMLDSLGDRMLVLAGGDGSVHTAVAALRRRGQLGADRPLGVLPLGTGNDLARTVGIPLDPAEAAEVLLAGAARPLDLVVDDVGGVVVNAAHLGVGAQAAARANALKDSLGKAAYAVGGLVAGAVETGWDVRVEVDGATVHGGGAVLMVALANGRTIGGGAVLAPAAEPDDGMVDVIVATSTGPLARLGFGLEMREGSHVSREDVVTAQGRLVSVVGEAFPINSDGEVQEPVTSRTWTVLPRAWALVVPSS